MILYIAEKPSLGRAIADALPKPHKKGEGHIQVGNGDIVSWCVGHLLEQAEPDAYDARYKKWQLADLPIIPETWQLKPKASTKKQLSVLRQLVKQADQLVHAGDPDREGQLLVDEVIEYLRVSQAKRQSMQRCLISDLNVSAVKKALTQLRSNHDFFPLSQSALARSHADWLYGINLTRAYTLQGSKVGYNGVLSVGRVQTPVLGLVVRRDEEIDHFQPKPFYEVLAHIKRAEGEPVLFQAKWQPSEACQPYMDDENRVLSKALAENVIRRIEQQPAEVIEASKKRKKQAPPLPYNLSSLQIDAAKRYGYSAKKVLDICQALYEKHKLITYPRSDCRYLPNEHWSQAPSVAKAIVIHCNAGASMASQADFQRKSKAWNDQKVEAHHAIIPTSRHSAVTLTGDEQNIYTLVCRQYLCQFYPDYVYDQQQVVLTISGGCFIARAERDIDKGWKALFAKAVASEDKKSSPLPALKKGEILHCDHGELVEKITQPPKPFNDATLLAAMTNIARFVKDNELRKILRETDGLGTEATRAGIIELLFKRGFLQRQGKQIRSTPAGRGLIHSLPDVATQPDMTARWEAMLDDISQGKASYNALIQPMLQQLRELVDMARASLPQALAGVKSVSAKRRRTYRKKRRA